MICPQCKAEYRRGFTRCTDCDVELVNSLPEAEGSVSKTIPSGPLVPLWEGEDIVLHTTLLKELESSGIRYFDQAMGVFPGARRWDPFPIQPMTRFGYQVAVLSSDLGAAKGVLEKLLDEVPADIEIPAQDDAAAAEPPLVVATETHPAVEIWNGNDDRTAQFLTAAMQENEIPIHLENPGEQTRIYVSASNEKRAREIVREIVEGASPDRRHAT